jgi:endonuclease/exonuclease/phosphatase family metal-dependent hydrolase
VRQVDADLVALQEVALASIDGRAVDQAARLGELTGRDHRYGAVHGYPLVEPESGQAVGAALWGNAVLSRHPIEAAWTVALPVVADDDPADPQDTEPRCALACHIRPPGGRLSFVSTHFGWRGRRVRQAQAHALAEMADRLSLPLLVGGDLNAPIEAVELAPLAGLADAFAAVGVPAGDRRRASCGPFRIDHLLAGGLEVLDCRVVVEAGDTSDHLPVVARVRLLAGSGRS